MLKIPFADSFAVGMFRAEPRRYVEIRFRIEEACIDAVKDSRQSTLHVYLMQQAVQPIAIFRSKYLSRVSRTYRSNIISKVERALHKAPVAVTLQSVHGIQLIAKPRNIPV